MLQVNAHVQDFAEKVRTMHRICSDLTNRIQQNKEKTQDLLSKTSALQNQKKRLESKQKAIDDFLGRFSLNEHEKRALEGNTKGGKRLESKQKAIDDFLGRFSLNEHEKRALEGNTKDGTITSDFFPALARARDIYIDSKELLRSSGEHSAAVEIMEEMSQTLERAYEVLYRSIQRECRILSADYVEMKAVLCQSFAALQEREVLLKYALDEVCTARKNQILRLYIDALTKGTHSNGKPIELMSHDPLRYMGDMLAWIYEALEGERELLQMLLKECDPQVIRENLTSLLSQISSALCRPFKLRVEQALAGESDSVVLYRLSALFLFYSEKMTPQIGPDSELARTVDELNQLTLNIFYSGLNALLQKYSVQRCDHFFLFFFFGRCPDYDLLPVSAVHQILMLLRLSAEAFLSVTILPFPKYQYSGTCWTLTMGAIAPRQNAEEEFNKIFGCVLDPLYRSVQVAATHLHSPLDVAVYTLNCLSAIYSLVILYPFTDSRLEMIKALMEGNEDVLVSEEASAILANTGLISLYQKAAAHDRNQGSIIVPEELFQIIEHLQMGAPDYDLLPVSAVHQILMLLRLSAEAFLSVTILPFSKYQYSGTCWRAGHSRWCNCSAHECRAKEFQQAFSFMEGNEDVLVSEEASAILANTGLISLYQKAAAHDRNQGPLSAIPGMDASTVNQILSHFDVYLSQPDNYQLDQVSKISSVRTRESVQQRTVDNVVAAYSVIVSKLEDPFNAYENVAFKSVEQVKELLK
ncbi:hypothetical protein COOONC_11620 [Cooperia oncophora]